MGQKKPPRANRLGVLIRDEKDSKPRLAAEHRANWFSNFKDFSSSLQTDWKIREAVKEFFGEKIGIAKIITGRKNKEIVLRIFIPKTSFIFKKDNKGIERFLTFLKKSKGILEPVKVLVIECSPYEPQVIADKVAVELEKRMPFRRAIKVAAAKAIAAPGVDGIKIIVSGRLGGADIARSESTSEGKLPLGSFRFPLENAKAKAYTVYGIIGVSVITNINSQALSSPSIGNGTGRRRPPRDDSRKRALQGR